MFYSFLRKFAAHILIGISSILVAENIIEGVSVEGGVRTAVFAGALLGFMNFFVRPLLKIVSFPLRLITLGLFTFVINISMVWFVGVMFTDLIIGGFVPLLYTVLVVWVLELVFYSFFSK